MNYKTSDSTVIKNLTIAKALLQKVRSVADENQITAEKIFNQYVSINFFFNNIIESQIIDCQIPEFTKLANNFNCYNDLENTTTLIRGIILNKVTHKTTSPTLDALYQELEMFLTDPESAQNAYLDLMLKYEQKEFNTEDLINELPFN